MHIVQRTPLLDEPGASRFVDMGDAYCATLRDQAAAAAEAASIELHEGVYAWVLGPQFETPAEIRMLRLMGAQASSTPRHRASPRSRPRLPACRSLSTSSLLHRTHTQRSTFMTSL